MTNQSPDGGRDFSVKLGFLGENVMGKIDLEIPKSEKKTILQQTLPFVSTFFVVFLLLLLGKN